jgi:cephalosporin hydroxylase
VSSKAANHSQYDEQETADQPTPQPVEERPVSLIVEDFHKLYYHSAPTTWQDTYWLGVPIQKCPLDLWVYQEIIVSQRPTLILETGTLFGGSALYLACLLDLARIPQGRVVTIDIEHREDRPVHPSLTYVTGSSVAPETLAKVRAMMCPSDRVMVILDSDHSATHVLEELRAYGPLVTPGSYLILEDTNVNGHPAYPDFGPGPAEALESFLAEDDSFEIDRSKEKFLMTFNPGGYLRKKL